VPFIYHNVAQVKASGLRIMHAESVTQPRQWQAHNPRCKHRGLSGVLILLHFSVNLARTMKHEIQSRLEQLLKSIQRDSDSLHASKVRYPEGEAVLARLFDAVQSTLQNVVELSADEPE
jgi:hypothetical protein